MALDRKTAFLNAIQAVLPVVVSLLKINPAYTPVIEAAITAAEHSDLRGTAKFEQAVQQTTVSGPAGVGISLGQVTDAVQASVALANAFRGLER